MPLTRSVPFAGFVAAVALVLGGCGGGSGPSADDAAKTLQQAIQAPPDQIDCMRDRFGDADVAAVMDPATAPSADQRARFVAAARQCIPIDAFATALSQALPDSLATADPAQSDCVRTTVVALSPADQDLLYLYFSNPMAVGADEVVPVSTKLTQACALGAADPSGGTLVGPVPPATG